jgi:hypothetical protein
MQHGPYWKSNSRPSSLWYFTSFMGLKKSPLPIIATYEYLFIEIEFALTSKTAIKFIQYHTWPK